MSGSLRFQGTWIGETQGIEMPAHLWEIQQRGDRLTIETRWEGEKGSIRLNGQLRPDGTGFRIGTQEAILIDAQHFVIPGWDTNEVRGGVGPAYDVVFSRPGIAELTAGRAWRRYRDGVA